MKPAPFAYHRPATAAEAVALLHELGDDAKVLAGGQSLVPMLSLRLAVFEHLIDIGGIETLRGIERRDDSLWIGAATTDAAVEASPEVAASAPLVARATPLIGHFQLRNRGTVGGSIAHADPAAEYPAVALALDARLEVLGPERTRTVEAVDFFSGYWETDLAADELLTGISFPVWSGRCGFGIEEVARRHGDFAMAGAAVALQVDDDDRVTRCGIGLLGLGPTPVRARRAEAEILGCPADELDADELGRLALRDVEDVPSDLHGSSEYRRRVGAVMVSRALDAARAEACSG